MKKNIDLRILGIIGSVLFMVIVAGGFVWIWQDNQSSQAPTGLVDERYKTVEIESVKDQAAQILKPTEKDNLSGMPVHEPASDQVGRANPFAGL